MRLEIIVPDNTSPNVMAKLESLTERLSASPELVEEIRFDDRTEDDQIQRMFTPELLAELEAADADIDAGNFVTERGLDEYFKQKTAEWINLHR